MKKLVSINLGNYGSTGRIMAGISQLAEEHGFETYMAYPISRNVQSPGSHDLIICSSFVNRINQKLAYLTGLNGCFAPITTLLFLKKLQRIKPDIIHLHNLHNSYINLPALFKYIKKNNIKVVWTLHDCWSFTGHCPYFTLAKCDRWKSGCGDCPQLDIYPRAKKDRTRFMWEQKKKWFTGVKDLTIVTPSKWLADLVNQSFLSEYPIKVINNGIDLSFFKPVESDFRKKKGISESDTMLLGVAFVWEKRKGIDVFQYLSERLDDSYKIVLVGTDSSIEESLPDSIVSVNKTHNQTELAEIYTSADILLNPTREDNFPTVNIEALACGTPVITFDTGGSPEIIDENCGSVVACDDIEGLLDEVTRVANLKPYSKESCLERAKKYNRRERFEDYIRLFET